MYGYDSAMVTAHGDLMIAPAARLAWSIYGYLCDSDPVQHVYFASWWSTILHHGLIGSENRVWLYRNFFMFIVYHLDEIFFRSLFLFQLHVRGFSSQRITSMIHFLSSVWNLLVSCGKESFEWFVSQAGGERMVWQLSTKQDVAFPWWYDEGCHPSNWFSLEPGCIQLVGFEHNLYVFCQN